MEHGEEDPILRHGTEMKAEGQGIPGPGRVVQGIPQQRGPLNHPRYSDWPTVDMKFTAQLVSFFAANTMIMLHHGSITTSRQSIVRSILDGLSPHITVIGPRSTTAPVALPRFWLVRVASRDESIR